MPKQTECQATITIQLTADGDGTNSVYELKGISRYKAAIFMLELGTAIMKELGLNNHTHKEANDDNV